MPVKQELDVIIDGLNLGRGMSFKNIAGHLPFGGCKATVTMDPLDMDNMEIMGFLAFALDSNICSAFCSLCLLAAVPSQNYRLLGSAFLTSLTALPVCVCAWVPF